MIAGGNMIKREITDELLRNARYFPIVTVMGPRQSGKTTLVRDAFPDYRYVNLEDANAYNLAVADPKEFLYRFEAPVIIDEIQRVPQLLNQLQCEVDVKREKGSYILTGSHQPTLAHGIAQSLAGRCGIVTLLPLTLSELSSAGVSLDRDTCIYNGFMPGIHGDGVPAELLYRNYYATYVERDVRSIINIKDLSAFNLFVRLLAGRVGNPLNLDSLSSDVGVSRQTLSNWLSVLESTYVIYLLRPYSANTTRRLTRSAKLYFTDTGLAAYLLSLRGPSDVAAYPMMGALFENMVVIDRVKRNLNSGERTELYYYRDKSGLEVDLIECQGGKIRPVEIKAARGINRALCGSLAKFVKLYPAASDPTVIYCGELEADAFGVRFLPFQSQNF